MESLNSGSELVNHTQSPGPRLILATFIVIIASLFVRFFTKLYHARARFVDIRRNGLPMPSGHSFIFGSLLFFKPILKTLPKNAHKNLLFSEILRRFFPSQGCCYIDMWPFSYPFLIIMSPTLANQATQVCAEIHSQRPPILAEWFQPIAGGLNLFDLPEKEWKSWRVVFGKGFSPDHVLSLVPGMVHEALTYQKTLRRHAQEGDLFYLDPTTLRFAMDFIGRTVLNASLGTQKGYNVLADSMLNQITWQMPNREVNPLELLNVARYLVQWWNGRKMDRYIGTELDKRYEELQADAKETRSKAVVDLILQAYETDSVKTNHYPTKHGKRLEPEFRAFAIRQIRLFLFVGHDSMSSTLCYSVHLLSSNPDALCRPRAEHNHLFGMDLSVLPAKLAQQPQLLNAMPYTSAVIKEVLRLFPPASGIRQGAAGAYLVDDDGTRYPTEDTIVWVLHTATHRAPEYWVRPDEFLPDRWLVESGHELYPIKGAWRPFEWGPRSCPGQALVMTELRVALAMILREFDFRPAYAEWDQLHPRKGPQAYRGERAYQIEEGAAHPADHYPCRVTFAGQGADV